MSKVSKKNVYLGIVVFFVVLVLGVKIFSTNSAEVKLQEDNPRIKGPKDAQIHIVEFIDFECPACAAGAKFLKLFMAENPDTVRLELKYFPLQMHKHAFESARYAQCAADQGKFWPYHDYLINKQEQWKQLQNATPAFDLIAKEVGLNDGKLRSCLEGTAADAVISDLKDEGKALGVRSTPTYFINGEMVVGHINLKAALEKLIVSQ